MLEAPMELLEIPDGETQELRITHGKFDQCLIHPERNPRGEVVDCLRVWVVSGTKQFEPFYYDITSKRLMAMLRPQLERSDLSERTFRVTAHGEKPHKYFSLEVR